MAAFSPILVQYRCQSEPPVYRVLAAGTWCPCFIMCYAPISAQPSPLGQELCRSAMGNVESDMEPSRKTSKTLTEPPCHSRTTTPGFSILAANGVSSMPARGACRFSREHRRIRGALGRGCPGPAPGRLGNFVPSARSPAPGGRSNFSRLSARRHGCQCPGIVERFEVKSSRPVQPGSPAHSAAPGATVERHHGEQHGLPRIGNISL